MLPFLTYAGGKMEERCILKNPNVSSLSQVLLLLLGAGNLLINFCFGRIVRTKRNNELQTHPQQNALKTHVGCLLSDLICVENRARNCDSSGYSVCYHQYHPNQ